ncbi:hypothetical protein BC829DRAFT_54868 [Chytridium lagenaria]|nr:hypothetical protein BC829DRAFT_54868 [Chytridium lagenaria]
MINPLSSDGGSFYRQHNSSTPSSSSSSSSSISSSSSTSPSSSFNDTLPPALIVSDEKPRSLWHRRRIRKEEALNVKVETRCESTTTNDDGTVKTTVSIFKRLFSSQPRRLLYHNLLPLLNHRFHQHQTQHSYNPSKAIRCISITTPIPSSR